MSNTSLQSAPLFYYAITGRHAGEDEDTCLMLTSESMERAVEAFRTGLDELSPNRAGREIFIGATLCSETPIADSDVSLQALSQVQDPNLANALISAARQHGKDDDPEHEVGDLQDLVRAMWRLMTPSQRVATLRAAEVQAIAQTITGAELPADLDEVSAEEISEALTALGLDPSLTYTDRVKLDAVSHMRVLPRGQPYVYCENWGHLISGSTEVTTRWAADTKNQTLIDAQYLGPDGWTPFDHASAQDLLLSIRDNNALSPSGGSEFDVRHAKDVSDLPEWVNAHPAQPLRERQGA